MTVRRRPHHLLCILTYVGKGYSPAFTVNMSAVAGRLAAGDEAEIVAGPDDICVLILGGSESHCRGDSVTGRDRAAADDLGGLLGLSIRSGVRLTLDASRIRRAPPRFRPGSHQVGLHRVQLE
ncbi:DUF1284 domain-containing protein [Pseudodonghicola xiamenensis]|uniref:Uncharacterized protein n=1 Tax=Pseudodonghicola xiamenensis TaxID=337702 RepID=A0A8J3H999_9RHOB|nr:DUF1284 domain-containing protein [Pseudodonghicola xiamenensis]GHG92849.1 hypothetical protein GCM10010961_24940 [Pseudodonghicola xiamenensis]